LTLAAGATDRADVASEHDRVAAITRDLSGAFLFGQDERTLWILTGDLTLQRGRPELAGESYTQALRRDAASADAWSGLGQARHATGDLAGALSALDTAQRLAPEDPWILNNRGVVERDLGRLDAACAAFETAARIAPELYAPAANLARTLERLGRVDEARAWRERAALLEGPRSP
jgi:tetratricopeptide (TPR) repeat protein